MKIISKDGIGVKALVDTAQRIKKILDDGDVIVGVIDGEALGGEASVGCLMAEADAGKRPFLAVTLEHNPRVLVLGDDDAA